MSINDMARRKVAGRLQRKRAEKARQEPGSLETVLAGVQNDELFTEAFLRNHVVRVKPSPLTAEEAARSRNKPSSTLLFLEAAEFKTFANEIRTAHKKWNKQPPADRAPFQTDNVYPCITVVRHVGPPVVFTAGDVQYSRIEYSVKWIKTLQPGNVELYAVGHLESAPGVGNDLPVDDGSDEDESDESDDEL